MATVALSLAGNAIAPGVGGFVGGLVGSYIDSNFIMPALFPPPDQKGPRLEDLQLQGANEGSPVPFCLGPECWTAGQIIWVGPLQEETSEEEIGGKGGPSQSVEVYSYFVDVAIALCRNPGVEPDLIQEMWADGRKVYDAGADVDVTSTSITAEAITRRYVNLTTTGGRTYREQYFLELTSPDGGPDLSTLRSGLDATISGYTLSLVGNNGTFRCMSSEFDRSTGISKANFRVAITGPPPPASYGSDPTGGDPVRVVQDLPEFPDNQIESFTFYDGTQTTADPTISAVEGAANTPSFHGTAYVVLKKLSLELFGNRVPNFQFLIQESASRTLASAIGVLLDRAGFESSQYDTTGVTGTLRGYVIRGPMSTQAMLSPLMLAFDILAQEDNGVLKFFDRDTATATTLDADELAAHEFGTDAPRVAEVTDTPGRQLPREVVVSYVDRDQTYERSAQSERRFDTTSDSVISIDLPIVMDAGDALCIARRIMWTAYANRERVNIQLPPSRLDLQESDIINVPAYGDTFRVLTRQVERGNNYLLRYGGAIEDADVLTFTSCPFDEPKNPQARIYVPPEVYLVFMDVGPLQDAQTTQAGFYYAAFLEDGTVSFPGAQILESTDGGSTFHFIGDIPGEAVAGESTDTLGDAVAGYWDRVNSVNVRLSHGSLSSATEADVLNGSNRAYIGAEIIGFATVVLESDGTYTLSNLIRGLRNSEESMDEHGIGDVFVLLSMGNVSFREVNLSAINTSRDYLAVPSGGVFSDYPSYTHGIRGNSIRPFSVYGAEGERNYPGAADVDDIRITWLRRTRAITRLFSTTGTPLLEETEQYELDIMNGTVVVRTVTVTGSTQYIYVDADQVTDFGSVQSSVEINFYQISASVGRGNVFNATV